MADNKIKVGIIGISEGNGHPYSWSAICNGYQAEEMDNCPFPVIPEYLAQQAWPQARLPDVEVTHIWTQERMLSEAIARASRIPHIVNKLEDLIGKVDAVLLARDDAANHQAMAAPFLASGMPVFIDKPLAFSVKEAEEMLAAQQYEGQLFSCSAVRYATELYLSAEEKSNIGRVRHIEACISKSWDLYAIHLLDPIIAANPDRGQLLSISGARRAGITTAHIRWEHLTADVSTYGKYIVPISIRYFGENEHCVKELTDVFSAFKSAIATFLSVVRSNSVPISRKDTLESIHIIESIRNV